MTRATGMLLALLLALTPAVAPAGTATSSDAAETSPLFVQQGDAKAFEESLHDEAEWAGDAALPTSQLHYALATRLSGALAQDEQTGEVQSTTALADTADRKNPGRALLLSAIMPGAGELYAGSRLKAALFFGIEMAAWYGAVSYSVRGRDKEREYENFADDHYVDNIYRQVEFQAARDDYGSEQFDPNNTGLTINDWNALSWAEKIEYLPGNFTHELPQERNQSYYENVGKYLTQFGYGWDDWIAGRPAQQIVAYAQSVNYEWDGQSARVDRYIDMRDRSNQLLDRSAMFFSVIMVNHVVSALDAGFTVRANNRDLARVEPSARTIIHNDEPVVTAGLNFRF